MTSSISEEICLSELASDRRCITEIAAPYRIVHVNSSWCQCTGYTQSEVIGRTCKMLQGKDTCRHTMRVREHSQLPATLVDPASALLPTHMPVPQALSIHVHCSVVSSACTLEQVLDVALKELRPITVRLINYRKDEMPFVNDLTVHCCPAMHVLPIPYHSASLLPCCTSPPLIVSLPASLLGWSPLWLISWQPLRFHLVRERPYHHPCRIAGGSSAGCDHKGCHALPWRDPRACASGWASHKAKPPQNLPGPALLPRHHRPQGPVFTFVQGQSLLPFALLTIPIAPCKARPANCTSDSLQAP